MLDSIAKLERENGRLQAENCHLQTELKSAERVRERFRAAMAKGSFTADEPQEKGTGAGESSQSSHTLDTPMPSSEVLRQFTDADIIKVRKCKSSPAISSKHLEVPLTQIRQST